MKYPIVAGRLSSLFLLWAHLVIVNAVRLPLDIEGHGPPPVEGTVVTGDMGMSSDLYKHLTALGTSRKVSDRPETNWSEENGIPTVPYTIRSEVQKFADVILRGILHWEEHTCIRFREKTAQDVAYLDFINSVGCWSYIGKLVPDKNQSVSIGDGCETLGTVVHEIGHAIGFLHEQMRADRDNYILINLNNVSPAKHHNFRKFSAVDYVNHGIVYDYTSVMQYGGMDFSLNGNLTMMTKDPRHQGLLGRGQILTHRDKHVANIQYKCTEKWLKSCGVTMDPCQNKGYLGSNCTCLCPPGTTGFTCKIIKGSYYDSVLPTCSRVITEETVFSSPNYPQYIKSDSWCMYHIKAPMNKIVSLKFLDFMFDRHSYSGPHRCATAFLEIRDKSLYSGTVVCGQDIAIGQTFISNSTDMILYLDVPSGRKSRGFKAEVTFHSTVLITGVPEEDIEDNPSSQSIEETTSFKSITSNQNGDAPCHFISLLLLVTLLTLTQIVYH